MGIIYNMIYKDYIKSEHWFNKKKELFKYQKVKECYICGSKKEIHTHHRTYKRLHEEKISDLVFLCSKCHKKIHDNKKDNIYNATTKLKKENKFIWGSRETADYFKYAKIGNKKLF